MTQPYPDVEAIARALAEANEEPGEANNYNVLARAVLALFPSPDAIRDDALEEAAKVVEDDMCECCRYVAADIRALRSNGGGHER